MGTQLERMRQVLTGSITTPPGYLLDLMTAWEEPRQKGEAEGLTNARELLAKSPKSFSEQMTKHLSEYMAVEKAAQEARAEEARAKNRVTQPEPAPKPEIDEGSERVSRMIEELLDKLEAAE